MHAGWGRAAACCCCCCCHPPVHASCQTHHASRTPPTHPCLQGQLRGRRLQPRQQVLWLPQHRVPPALRTGCAAARTAVRGYGAGLCRLLLGSNAPNMLSAGWLPLPVAHYLIPMPRPATTPHARPSARPLEPAGAWAWCGWWQEGVLRRCCAWLYIRIDSFQNCLLACVTALQFSHAAHIYAVGGRCHFPLTAFPTLFPLPAFFCTRLAPFQRPLAGQQLSSFFFPHFLSSDRRVLARLLVAHAGAFWLGRWGVLWTHATEPLTTRLCTLCVCSRLLRALACDLRICSRQVLLLCAVAQPPGAGVSCAVAQPQLVPPCLRPIAAPLLQSGCTEEHVNQGLRKRWQRRPPRAAAARGCT